MREFQSLAALDDYLQSLAHLSEVDAAPILANTYLAAPEIVDVPADPFSSAYAERVREVYFALSGRKSYDVTSEHSHLDVLPQAKRPTLYQSDSVYLGQYLESFGHLLKTLDAKPGMRMLEPGAGDAQVSLQLARLGCDVTTLDAEPAFAEVVQRQAAMYDVPITALHGEFMDAAKLEPFDRIFFYQSFHHSAAHQQLLAALPKMLRPGGFVVFSTEPIIDADGPWRHAVPYPWGPRLDGLSLKAMRQYGWMELGFQKPYFNEALRRAGFAEPEHFSSPTNGLVFSIKAQPSQ
jgi:2-polyprenyl-3-methyl-5-hydroxy-6-metoxy-1,4-benzoquinol methylase